MNWEKLGSPARATLKNTKISLLVGKNLEVQPKDNTQKIPILNLWGNCENLCPNLSFTIVIRNGKIVWKHGSCCLYFRLNLKYLGWPYREYIKTAKNGDFCEELLSENDFEAVLATFCCYDHDAKVSEAVQKIAADQKDYDKYSSCVTIC